MANTRLHQIFDVMLKKQVISFTEEGRTELYFLSDNFNDEFEYIIDKINNDGELCIWSEEDQECIYEVQPEWLII